MLSPNSYGSIRQRPMMHRALRSEHKRRLCTLQDHVLRLLQPRTQNLTEPDPFHSVCEPASYNFTGGTPPYQDLYIIKSGQSEADIFHTLPKDEVGP